MFPGAGEKIRLSDLLGRMDQVPSAVSQTKKQLKHLQNRKDTVELPLSRQQSEKVCETPGKTCLSLGLVEINTG